MDIVTMLILGVIVLVVAFVAFMALWPVMAAMLVFGGLGSLIGPVGMTVGLIFGAALGTLFIFVALAQG